MPDAARVSTTIATGVSSLTCSVPSHEGHAKSTLGIRLPADRAEGKLPGRPERRRALGPVPLGRYLAEHELLRPDAQPVPIAERRWAAHAQTVHEDSVTASQVFDHSAVRTDQDARVAAATPAGRRA